jgi:signal transduction histidine kinase
VNALKIKAAFKSVLDEIQYDYKISKDDNYRKLSLLVFLYQHSRGKFDPDRVAAIINKINYTPGIYQVFMINKKLIVQNASYKPDIGLNLGAFKAYRKVLESVFSGKKKIDVSYPILDYSSMYVKKYYLIRSPDKKYLLQLAFCIDLYSIMKKAYEKALKQRSLKDLKVYFMSKYIIYNINFKERYRKKLQLPLEMRRSRKLFFSVLKEMGVSPKIINKLKEKKVIQLPKVVDKIFDSYGGRIIKLDLKHHTLDIFLVIRGIFSNDNRLIIKVAYNTLSLEKNIEALKRRFLLNFMLLMIVIFVVYELVVYKVSREIKEIVEHIKTNTPVEKTESFIEEIDKLKKKYNLFRKSLNEQIEKNKKLLEENKRFIVDTIHQIKTPLSVITLNVDFIKKKIKNDEEKELIDEIEAAVTMLSNSYEDLSYISGNGMLRYEAKEAIDISDLLKQRIEFFKTVAKANNKEIISDIQKDIYFKINKIEFERIADNNLSNAIKYSKGREIYVSLKKEGNRIILKFESFGDRIKNPDYVFEKNYREHSHKRGLGIGLNIVKTICDKYGIIYKVYYENGKNVFEYIFRS